MKRMIALALATAAVLASAAATRAENQDGFKLPPEVTPALRAACEADVRRLCVRAGSTIEQVKSCVVANYARLGRQCQIEIASSGLAN
jgi:hypothetical protein